jgi:nucleoside phosphorylase
LNVPVVWQQTLKVLQSQFEAAASQSHGLHHIFVEAASNEREKLVGPSWFAGIPKEIRFVDGRPQYAPWDCCASSTLPGVNPAFREPRPDEVFVDGGPQPVRDASGIVRAVAVPLKVRVGYYCGPGAETKNTFDSLANAAASALAGAPDLQSHPFTSEISDIFRRPRGWIRYIFGEVDIAPAHYISRGWAAGILSFPRGVLIDVPIAENPPDANHWMLLLHRLGWRHVMGTGLQADRFGWDGNLEATWQLLLSGLTSFPEQIRERYRKISRETYYSVLGTKNAALDVNLASVFAIQLLLADLESTVTEPRKGATAVDYSNEPWRLAPIPELRTVDHDAALLISQPKVGILVATEVERQAVLKKMRHPAASDRILQVFSGNNTCFIGRLGIVDVVLCMTAMGSIGRDASTIVTMEVITLWKLDAVIMSGIAFGKDATKQQIGNVLVSERIISYEPQRVGAEIDEDRGSEPGATPVLLNRFRNVVGWSFSSPDGRPCYFQVGPILSGEKLVDNLKLKTELFSRYPTAIGGEMEGAGFAAAAERNRCEWIVVKAICDWGDGSKVSHHQEFAAASSVDMIEHVLNQPGSLGAVSERGSK